MTETRKSGSSRTEADVRAAEMLLRLARKKHLAARAKVRRTRQRLQAAKKAHQQAKKSARLAKRRRTVARRAWKEARAHAASPTAMPRMGGRGGAGNEFVVKIGHAAD